MTRHLLKIFLAQFLAGLIFGLGLAISGMTSPQNVLAFLDLSDDWSPALFLVLGSAVSVAGLAFFWILERDRPLLDPVFHISPDRAPNTALVVGSLLFGIGWGISGYCPGPAVALLAVPDNPETLVFLGGLAIGYLADYFVASDGLAA